MLDLIKSALSEASQSLANLQNNAELLKTISEAGTALGDSLLHGSKVLSCGNGGSMCDAMHFAEELTGRFRSNRKPLAAIPLSDPSHISCVSNDFGYDEVFSRSVQALGRKGDFLLAISTSGNSSNILKAAKKAQDIEMQVISLTGKNECELAKYSDFHIATTSVAKYSDRVQELHIKVIHILIEIIEKQLKNG